MAGLQGCQSFSFLASHCVSLEKGGKRSICNTQFLLLAGYTGGQREVMVTVSPSSLSGQRCRLIHCSLACRGETEASLVSTSSN